MAKTQKSQEFGKMRNGHPHLYKSKGKKEKKKEEEDDGPHLLITFIIKGSVEIWWATHDGKSNQDLINVNVKSKTSSISIVSVIVLFIIDHHIINNIIIEHHFFFPYF